MTYLNDLALMLSEVMNQMQQQMANKMPGNQMCNKPGGNGSGKSGKSGKVPMDKIVKGQQELNGEMQKMSEQMKSGQQGKMSKEFAQMAAWVKTCVDCRIDGVVNQEQEGDNKSRVEQLKNNEVRQRNIAEQQGYCCQKDEQPYRR